MKAIIIDDEQHSHDRLISLLKNDHPEIQVDDSAYSVKEGLATIHTHRPDLVFLDIELPDGLGFNVLDAVKSLSFQLIFITAHNKYAIRAIRAGALDYLLKPIDSEELKVAVSKAFSAQSAQSLPTSDQVNLLRESIQLLNEQRLPSRLAVSTVDGIIYQQVDEILRLEADTNYTKFFITQSDKPFVASLNLGEFEDQFTPYPNFMRVHRSHLINLKFVHKFIRKDRMVHMTDGSEVKISNYYLRKFLKVMEKV